MSGKQMSHHGNISKLKYNSFYQVIYMVKLSGLIDKFDEIWDALGLLSLQTYSLLM